MQRGCHFGAGGSDVFECRFRLLDYNDVPDVFQGTKKNTVARDVRNKEERNSQNKEKRNE